MQALFDSWRFFSLKDLFDVLIVAVFAYQFIKVLRGTRSMQMVLGIFLLGVISLFGQNYNLHSINWLLENFFDSFIIILVILFQEEIRSALIAMANRQTFFTKFKKNDYEDEIINEIVEACWELKKSKTGSILILENLNGLNNLTQSGVQINGNVHRDLITTIFSNKGPLHDGAAIIRKNKLVAASCFLPLKSKEELDSQMGARHRAALAVSQMVDSLVIVTSEERGEVSFFYKNKIIPIDDSFSLKRIIKFLWGTGEDLEQIMPQLFDEGSLFR
ncbi:MAG: TIGR00159 family protein [Halobacteriovoraceae bacterium]|nr:TIGR00159 family protein [Halobacteriovoraceae bacterium]